MPSTHPERHRCPGSQAVGLPVGQQCVVATTAPDSRGDVHLVLFRGVGSRTQELGSDTLPGVLRRSATCRNDGEGRGRAAPAIPGVLQRPWALQAAIDDFGIGLGCPTTVQGPADILRMCRSFAGDSATCNSRASRRRRQRSNGYMHLNVNERPSAITRYRSHVASTCQLCEEPGFVMRNGQRYCEAHHRSIVENPAPRVPRSEYLVILCARHCRTTLRRYRASQSEGQTWQVRRGRRRSPVQGLNPVLAVCVEIMGQSVVHLGVRTGRRSDGNLLSVEIHDRMVSEMAVILH